MDSNEHASAPAETSRILIQSVGRADARILHVLQQLVDLPAAEIARLVYQAPSEIVASVSAAKAEEIVPLLEDAGLELCLSSPELPFEPGRGEYEIALAVHDVSTLPKLIPEVAALLGTDLATARRLVLSTPAVILGSVSQATVEAMRRRFAPYPVTIDVSRIDSASFYVIIASESASLLGAAEDIARKHAPPSALVRGPGMLTVSDIDHGAAEALWQALRRTGAHTTVCNLDFERYDVRLESAPESEPEKARARALLADLGVPAQVAPRVLDKLPIVIQQNARHDDAMATIARVADCGGRASATPYSSNRFAVLIDEVRNPAQAARVLEYLAEMSGAAAESALTRDAPAPIGNFTKTAALWLKHELLAAGTRVHLAQL